MLIRFSRLRQSKAGIYPAGYSYLGWRFSAKVGGLKSWLRVKKENVRRAKALPQVMEALRAVQPVSFIQLP